MEIWEITKGSGTTMTYEEIVAFCELYQGMNTDKNNASNMCFGLINTAMIKQWITLDQEKKLLNQFFYIS